MEKNFAKNKNSIGEVTVFDRKKQRSVGGTMKTKNGWFTYKFIGKKIKLTNLIGSTKTEAEKRLRRIFK